MYKSLSAKYYSTKKRKTTKNRSESFKRRYQNLSKEENERKRQYRRER